MNKNLLKSKKIKVIFALIAIIICTGAISIASKAQTEKRAANIKSKGIFDYDSGTVVMDASDLTYLADEIDLLENTYKTETVKALNQIGTYYKLDGTTSFNKNEGTLSSDNANVLPYNAIIDGIINSQSVTTKTSAENILSGMQAWVNGAMLTGTMPNNGTTGISDLKAGDSYTIPSGYTTGGTVKAASLASQTSATATAENLSDGVTAWVNGVKITGNGEDNKSAYIKGYDEGYKEGSNIEKIYEKAEISCVDFSDYDQYSKVFTAPNDGILIVANTLQSGVGVEWKAYGTLEMSVTYKDQIIFSNTVNVNGYDANNPYNIITNQQFPLKAGEKLIVKSKFTGNWWINEAGDLEHGTICSLGGNGGDHALVWVHIK